MRVEIVILNFNGGDLFLECLPSFVEAVKRSRYSPRLVVLDNGSTDGSEKEAVRRHPEIRLVYAPSNRILCSYNDYLKDSDSDIAVLMNNDIRVDPGFLDPLVSPFEGDPETFMVTSRCLNYDGSAYEGGITQFRMRYGIFWASSRFPGHESRIGFPSPTMAAGYGAFRRLQFLKLGGYDDLYLPGRLEDTDLCFRAWKRGWKLLYEPSSVIYHKGGVSFHKHFGVWKTLRINHRNSFLFIWKNLRDPVYLLTHIFLLPFRLLFALLRGQTEFLAGFLDALPLFPRALKRRKAAMLEPAVLSDRAVFEKVPAS